MSLAISIDLEPGSHSTGIITVSTKTWLDVWTLDLDDLHALRERTEWRVDVKYQKIRAVLELCEKYHRRDRSFYSKRIPCNMVMMNGDGEFEILKMRPMIQSSESITPGASPALAPSPQVLISKELMEVLKSKEQDSE
ncbi:hypothetical protein ACLOJK_008380 [Asimina triloba]